SEVLPAFGCVYPGEPHLDLPFKFIEHGYRINIGDPGDLVTLPESGPGEEQDGGGENVTKPYIQTCAFLLQKSGRSEKNKATGL
ncbi:MAG TPA: hypothetical protein DEP46_06435, partial [Blastocatellia bacterium]|nr:hypothetical protein [Blastocatellia bacterium]